MKSIYLPIVIGVIVGSVGCGNTDGGPKAVITPPNASQGSGPGGSTCPSKADSVQAPIPVDRSVILTLLERDLHSVQNKKFPGWEMTLPDIEHLREFDVMSIVSADLAKYSFNQVDIYVDPYEIDESHRIPSFQVSLPASVLEKTDQQIRFPFPGAGIAYFVDSLTKKDPNESQQEQLDDIGRIRVRILLSDSSQSGNPIIAGLVGTVWEAQ